MYLEQRRHLHSQLNTTVRRDEKHLTFLFGAAYTRSLTLSNIEKMLASSFNTLKRSGAHNRKCNESLAQVMAGSIFGAKPLSEPMTIILICHWGIKLSCGDFDLWMTVIPRTFYLDLESVTRLVGMKITIGMFCLVYQHTFIVAETFVWLVNKLPCCQRFCELAFGVKTSCYSLGVSKLCATGINKGA